MEMGSEILKICNRVHPTIGCSRVVILLRHVLEETSEDEKEGILTK